MSSLKNRRRAKRRTYKLVASAWTALESGQGTLAWKNINHAVRVAPANAGFRVDLALIARALGDDPEPPLRSALALSPDFTEAKALLAEILAERAVWVEALTLQAEVVRAVPSEPSHLARLETWKAQAPADVVAAVFSPPPPPWLALDGPPVFTARTARYDWDALAEELSERGCVRLPGLLTAAECALFRDQYTDADRFEHEVALTGGKGRLTYRFFRPPLPDLLSALRAELYGRAAVVVNRWHARIGSTKRFPKSYPAFQSLSAHHSHTRSAVVLLRYPRGGFNAPHQDVHGGFCFPLQCAITLGPAGAEGGGAFSLIDQRPGRKRRGTTVETAPGDGVLFCARDRLCRVAGRLAWQSVAHSVGEVTAEERYAIGLPLHDYLQRQAGD